MLASNDWRFTFTRSSLRESRESKVPTRRLGILNCQMINQQQNKSELKEFKQRFCRSCQWGSRIRNMEYSVKRCIEGMLGDLVLQLIPQSRRRILNGKRDYPVSCRHGSSDWSTDQRTWGARGRERQWISELLVPYTDENASALFSDRIDVSLIPALTFSSLQMH